MLDPKLIRSDPQLLRTRLRKKKFELDVELLTELDSRRKQLQLETEALRNERKSRSRVIGKARAAGEDISELLTGMDSIKTRLEEKSAELTALQERLGDYLMGVPNVPDDSVPDGDSELANRVLDTRGAPRQFDFPVKDHTELGETLQQGLDFAAAGRMTGSRFVVMEGRTARLHRALVQFMLDLHTQEHGYREVNVPCVVNRRALEGTGQLPKFSEDLFRLEHEQEFYLIPTSEVPVTNLLRESIVEADRLPLKYACHSLCFRSEAGSYGKDTRGMIRQHQFEKVELVQIVRPSESPAALEELTGHAEEVLRRLELPYRKVALCGGEMGFAAALTYDLEVWLPSLNTWREISSCSNFTDFQARRMLARWRNPATGKPEPVHTLNGSGLAVGRTLVAIMENNQDESGRVRIPEVLRPYMMASGSRLEGAGYLE